MNNSQPTNFLKEAKKNKNDEFYTLLADIERELQYYQHSFKNKVVFCNCDDPIISNFYRYFAQNFKELGLKKLIASCYREGQSGYYYEYTGKPSQALIPNREQVTYFQGNGDFRSTESVALLQQADIVVTNPPFSLFRDFIKLLVTYKKQFLVIGNINCITYKEIFALIQDNQAWLGINLGRGISGFIVPPHYALYGTETKVDEHGNRIVATNNCLWLTNLDNFKRHEFINLTKTYQGNEEFYPQYDNYLGINVNKTQDIPKDYPYAIGVPITFLHKFNPQQFSIIKFRKGNDNKDLSINGKCPYFRILVKLKHPQT